MLINIATSIQSNMKKILLSLGILLSNLNYAQINYNWAKPLAGGNNEEGRSVVTDAAGNVYSTGIFSGTVDFDPGAATLSMSSSGGNDVYISKLSASGTFLWAKKIGNTNNESSWGIAVDGSDNVYITGSFYGTCDMNPGGLVNNAISAGQSDVFILKLDPNGNYMWAKTFGGTDFDGATSIAIDAAGNIITTGSFRGTADFDPGAGVVNYNAMGSDDIFISKLDASGNFVFAKVIGSSGQDWGNGLAIYAGSQILVTGTFQNTADFDPGAGTTNLTSVGSFDIFVLKLDVNGNFDWAKSMGGTGTDQGRSIAMDGSGQAYICGEFFLTTDFDPGAGTFTLTSNGNSDAFICKLDGGNGNFQFAKQIGGINPDFAYSIKIDNYEAYIAGTFIGTVDFNPGPGTYTLATASGLHDGFIVKLNNSGIFSEAFALGGSGNDGCYGIHTDGNGALYATGWYSNTVDFDPGTATNPLISMGLTDVFVLKLNQASVTGLKETPPALNVQIYPNPASSAILIKTDVPIETVSIYNLSGQLVQQENANTFSVEPLASGVYILNIKTEKGNSITRFIKE